MESPSLEEFMEDSDEFVLRKNPEPDSDEVVLRKNHGPDSDEFVLRVSNLPSTSSVRARTPSLEQTFRELLSANSLGTLLSFQLEEDSLLLKFANYRQNITALRKLNGKFFLGRKLVAHYLEKEPRQTPIEVHTIYKEPTRFRTKMCEYVDRQWQCPRGMGCMYAHTSAQLARATVKQVTQRYRVLLFNLPPMVTQSQSKIIEFLKNLSLDYGLLEFQVDIISVALRLWYDTPENVVHALKGIDRVRNICDLPAMGIQWMDPEGYCKTHNGPPHDVYQYYANKANPEVSDVQLECWMHKYKECSRSRCPFLHTEQKDDACREEEIEPENVNEIVSMKNWWGAQDGELGPMLSVSNLLRKDGLTEPMVRDLFSPFGIINDLYLVKASNGKNSGVAFIEFQSITSCAQALKLMNGYIWQDEPIYSEYRHPPGAGGLVYPDPILSVYSTLKRRKTRMCSFSEFQRNCPNYHRCPFAHARNERIVAQFEVVIDIFNIPADITKECVEKHLWKHASIDRFEWCAQADESDDASGRALFTSLDSALGSLDLVAGLTITGEETINSLSAEFSTETRAPAKVIEFYQRDRFSKTRLCDFASEACPLKDDCPFAHHKDEVYPCVPLQDGVASWRAVAGVKVPLHVTPPPHPASYPLQVQPMPSPPSTLPPAFPPPPLSTSFALPPPFLPSLMSSVFDFLPQHPLAHQSAVNPVVRSTASTAVPDLGECAEIDDAEGDAIDFSKATERAVGAKEESVPLEWEETDAVELAKKKAKLKAKKDKLGIYGFPLQWDVSTARKLLESIGDLFDVSIKEPGYIEIEIAREDREAWVTDIEALLVDGNPIRLVSNASIKRKRGESPMAKRRKTYADFV